MKLQHTLSSALVGIFLLLSTSSQAAMYEVVCVECSLTDTSFTVQSLAGVVDTGTLQFPNEAGDFDFNLLDLNASAYNSSFYFLPGTYSFDSQGDAVTPPQTISMTVGEGQVGMHFLFDWGTNSAIDVLAVFDVITQGSDTIFVPTDVDGNFVTGFSMVDGPFQGQDIAIGFTVVTPLPAAVWLFGTGLLGLLPLARRRKKA